MSGLAVIESLAASGKLYPSVIIHGGSQEARMEQAMRLARVLLCETDERRPDGCACRHCRRIVWPAKENVFHPDLGVMIRDLRTATSAEGTRELLRTARLSPFEARGQVFVIAEAGTLTAEAASALLKILEEPPRSAPRHFLLLCPNPDALLPTLRSRSMLVYLGAREELDTDRVGELGQRFAARIAAYADGGSHAHLLAAAQVLHGAAKWDDPRASEPWVLAAGAVVEAQRGAEVADAARRPLLELAGELLEWAPQIRVRAVPALRILEGLVAQHLAGVATLRPRS